MTKGTKFWSRDRKMTGVATGGSRHCHMEGCRGTRIGVRWSDGVLTFPCTHGLQPYNGGYRLI
jgi:hypothetical protein